MRVHVTTAQIASFKTALEMFELDCGRYPTTAESLQALTICPTNISQGKWHLYIDKILLDPWGHAYLYRCPGRYNTNTYDLYSCGEDGISQSEGNDIDDINNFDPELPRFNPNRGEQLAELVVISGLFAVSILALLLLWRFSKPAGNLHGVLAVIWIIGSVAIGEAVLFVGSSDSLITWVTGSLLCGLAVPVGLAVSGIRRGCLISKICGWIIVIPLLLFLLLLIAAGLGLTPKYA